jgi:hypothetical protein
LRTIFVERVRLGPVVGAVLGRVRLDRFGDGEVHVGGRETKAPLLAPVISTLDRIGDRVAPLDHTLDMGQRLQEGLPVRFVSFMIWSL